MENGTGLQLCEDGVQRWSEAMIWEKKARQNEPKNSEPISTPSARQVIVFGKVDGKINARDKIELRKTGYVIGDLTSMGIAIEEGAYFKGSIEILREAPTKAELPRVASAVSAVAAKAVN